MSIKVPHTEKKNRIRSTHLFQSLPRAIKIEIPNIIAYIPVLFKEIKLIGNRYIVSFLAKLNHVMRAKVPKILLIPVFVVISLLVRAVDPLKELQYNISQEKPFMCEPLDTIIYLLQLRRIIRKYYLNRIFLQNTKYSFAY